MRQNYIEKIVESIRFSYRDKLTVLHSYARKAYLLDDVYAYEPYNKAALDLFSLIKQIEPYLSSSEMKKMYNSEVLRESLALSEADTKRRAYPVSSQTLDYFYDKYRKIMSGYTFNDVPMIRVNGDKFTDSLDGYITNELIENERARLQNNKRVKLKSVFQV